MYNFNSSVKELNRFSMGLSNDLIKNETMFFNSDLDFAYNNGGPITQSFIDALPGDWKDCPVVFDSRVHMLMPGWYPAIPGWHHDDVPRPPIPVGQHFATAGQPNYKDPHYHSEHILGLVNADVCPTHFAIGECEMPEVEDGQVIYRVWNDVVEELLSKNHLEKVTATDRTLYQFDCNTFHTGTQAVKNGWRWFGRVSRNTDRTKTVTNEIRRNAQVYLEFPTQGW